MSAKVKLFIGSILVLAATGCIPEYNGYPCSGRMFVNDRTGESTSGVLAGRSSIHLWFDPDTSDHVSCRDPEDCEEIHVDLVGRMTYLGRTYDTLRLGDLVGGLDPFSEYLFDETFSVQSDSLLVRVFSGKYGRAERRTVYRFSSP